MSTSGWFVPFDVTWILLDGSFVLPDDEAANLITHSAGQFKGNENWMLNGVSTLRRTRIRRVATTRII